MAETPQRRGVQERGVWPVFGSTMLLTVGHAIDRAKDEDMVVRLHVGGEWVTGRILNSDGHGVALLESNGDVCVVRQESISCVRLSTQTSPHVPSQPGGWVDQPA
jgi:hypothetical protein